MKTRTCDFSEKVLAGAVQLALLALFIAPGLAAAQSAAAPPADQKTADRKTTDDADDEDDGDVKALICPTNYLEVGALNVSSGAPKFGEYNGMARSGGYGIGNFSISGGSGYCQRGGNVRWQAYGTDLGTTSRNIGVTATVQGQWSIGLDFDQLRHYTTTGYQTPYDQSPGSNVFALPPSFGVINTTAGTHNLTATQLASLRSLNVYNQRENTTFKAGYNFNTEWDVKFNYKHLDMSGAKLISSGTDAYNMTSLGGFNYGSQGIQMLMNPTKSSTDNFDLAFNWTGKKAYASFGYYGSLYHDDYSGLSWSNPFVSGGTAAAPNPAMGASPGSAFPTDTMSTPPSNQFHQLNFTGGYIFSPKTKLNGGLSFGLNTQDASYGGTYTTTPNTVPGLPVNSLDGRVLTKHADARLTHEFTPALNLNVGFKYNERDNNTPVNTYQFLTIGGGSPVTVTNAPMSNRREQADASLAYRLDKRQRLNFSYNYDHIERWCNNALAANAQGSLSAANAGYYSVASCAQVPDSTDNSLTASYKLNLIEKVSFNAGYTFADRKATVNPSFYNPMQSNSSGFENYGWMAWFQGSRRENALKAGVDWQVTPKFTLGLDGRYAKDDYYDSTLGVQNGKSSNVNLSADYTASENMSFGAYMSWQDQSRDLLSASDKNAMAPPVNLWYNSLTDRDTSIGVYGKQKFRGGKLQLTEDLSYGLGRSSYDTTLGANIAPAVGNSGSTPDIKSELIQFRLTGSYDLNKHSRITAGWLYQRLKSNDYYYYAYQYGFTPTSMLPTNQQAPTYTVNVLYLLYRYSFQ
ncbi:MAG: MtrB/PioB family decaheme-associated outer membrane protein [Burkholderiaceae bacterium]|jgi:MtrB/PioB family decaheme-associated outer membrane protein|nr:MtrB/PioB family decaheme-associated outer membrane protein [Burkholderiaceae bacterium]